MDKKVKNVSVEIIEKDINTEKKTLTAYVSTCAIDRDGEVITADLIDDGNYNKNPIVLFQHDANKPIGKSLWRKPNEVGLLASTQFAKNGLGEEIFDLYAQKILNAFSIGFMPLEAGKFIEQVYHYGKVELLEYSSVSVPCNPSAVTLGFVKSLKNQELKDSFINDFLIESFETDIKSLKELVAEIKANEPNDIELIIQEEKGKWLKELTPKFNEIINEVNKLKSFKNKIELKNIIGK